MPIGWQQQRQQQQQQQLLMQQAHGHAVLAQSVPAMQDLPAQLVGGLHQGQEWQGQRWQNSRHVPFTHVNDAVGGAGVDGMVQDHAHPLYNLGYAVSSLQSG